MRSSREKPLEVFTMMHSFEFSTYWTPVRRPRRIAIRGYFLPALLLLVVAVLESPTQAQDKVSFSSSVAPILTEHCVACHSAKRAEGGYRIDTIDWMRKPGDSGHTPVTEKVIDQSEVWKRVVSADASERMPADSEPLPPEQLAIIKQWIEQGADVAGLVPTDPLWKVIPPQTYAAAPEHYANRLPVTSLRFSSDGTELFSSGYHELLVWNTSDGQLKQRIGNQVERIHSIELLNDGAKIGVAGGTPGALGELRIVNRATGLVESVPVRATDVILDTAIRPGSKEVACAIADNTIRLVDWEQNSQRKLITSHADWIFQIAYTEDGKRFGSASRDKSAKVFDADTGELLASYTAHGAAVRGVAPVDGGNQWCTVGADNKWHRWEVEGTKKVAEGAFGAEPNASVRAGSMLFIPCNDKHWYRLDFQSNSFTLKQPGATDWVIRVALHPATNQLATGSVDGSIHLWNLNDGALLRTWVAKP